MITYEGTHVFVTTLSKGGSMGSKLWVTNCAVRLRFRHHYADEALMSKCIIIPTKLTLHYSAINVFSKAVLRERGCLSGYQLNQLILISVWMQGRQVVYQLFLDRLWHELHRC